MGSWFAFSNVLEVVAAWAVTAFGIPWFNKRFHTNIPDPPLPKTEEEISELSKLIMQIWQPEIERHLKHWHSVRPVPMPTPAPPGTPSYTFTTASTPTPPPPPPAATTLPDSGVSNA